MHPMKRPNGHTVHDVHAIEEAIVGGSVDADAPLMEAGIDSLGAVELRNQLQSAMGGHSLSTTVVFDHPTARQLAALLQPMQQASAIAAAPINTTDFDMAIEETSSSLAVVVSGVSVALPSSVVHMDALCTMSLCGHDLLCVIPSSRWDVDQAALDLQGAAPEVASRVRHGGFLLNAELLQNGFFSIAAAEALAMDPQQRQLLERGYGALHALWCLYYVYIGKYWQPQRRNGFTHRRPKPVVWHRRALSCL